MARDSTPEALLAHARQGDRESLGALLDLYRNYLQLLARTQINLHLRGRVSASDLLQETYVRACDRFGQFRGKTEKEWLGWLRRILVHTLVNLAERHLQAVKRDARREVSLERLFERVDHSSSRLEDALVHQGSSPSAQAARHESAAALADRLEQLPPDYRDVLVLRNLEGLSFREVAARMGRSEGAVSMLWMRALERLRKQIHASDGRL